MRGTYLGEFQELVLLSILVLAKQAYGVSIQEKIGNKTGRAISRGALHSALSRLEDKGYIESEFGEATAERGGRRKKFYQLTNLGQKALNEAKSIRESYYSAIDLRTQNS